MVYEKQGRLQTAQNREKVIIQNKKGENYQVNFVVAYVWQCLNGKNTQEQIARDLAEHGEVPLKKARVVVDKAIMALMDIGLIQEH
jgi:methyltransferase-like protein